MAVAKPDQSTYPALLEKIKAGQIKIPQFQRDFVWTVQKSSELLDSVIKGYPVGTLIFWSTDDRLRSVRNIGSDDLPEPESGKYVEYVLDGQQRVTSLYAALEGKVIKRESGQIDDFGNICIDLDAPDDEQVVHTEPDVIHGSQFIFLRDVLHGGISLANQFESKYFDRIDELRNRINTYSFPIIQVSGANLDVATEVFTRINVGGKVLTTFEIMVAKTYDEKRSFDLTVKSEELLEKLAVVDFETIPDITMLQFISILLTGECRRKTILGLSKSDFIDSWNPAFEAMQHAVDHLRTHYGVRASRLLPYNGLVIPFAYFYYKNSGKQPTGHQARLLEDFFWRCGLGARYSSGLEGKLAQDCASRINPILEGTLPKYDWAVTITPEFIIRNGWFTPSRATIKSLLCLYAALQPLNFKTSSPVTLGNDYLKQANSRNYHHFFPKAYLTKSGYSNDLINNIVNITIIDAHTNKNEIRAKPPSDYLKKYEQDNSQLNKALRSHLIQDFKYSGLLKDSYDSFLQKRAARISAELQKRIIPQAVDSSGQVPDSGDTDPEAGGLPM